MVTAILALLITIGVAAQADPARFLFLLEGDGTLAASGHERYRTLYADAIERAARGGAAGVALKFFFLEADPKADARLAASMRQLPAHLQFALVGDPEIDHPIPRALAPNGSRAPQGWMHGAAPDLPVPLLAEHASGFGFVDVHPDFDVDLVPLYGALGDTGVPAFTTTLLAARFPDLQLDPDALALGVRSIPVAPDGRVECDVQTLPDDAFLALDDLLTNRLPADALRDAVVVIGYDGAEAPNFRTGWLATRSAHRMFMDRLACLARMIEDA